MAKYLTKDINLLRSSVNNNQGKPSGIYAEHNIIKLLKTKREKKS